MRKLSLKHYMGIFGFIVLSVFISHTVHAQLSDEATEQREFEESDDEDEYLRVIKNVEDIFQQIKERAKGKVEEKKKKLLRKIKISAGFDTGYETNVLHETDNKSGAGFAREKVRARWLPIFSKKLGAELEYSGNNVNYFGESDLNNMINLVSGSLKIYPIKEIKIEPGISFQNVHYFNDERATYNKTALFLDFRHYKSRKWNYGGGYEFSHKIYEDRLSRNSTKVNVAGQEREDNRHTVSAYYTRYFGTYSVRVRGKGYINDSNDNFQNFYDFESYRGYVTFAKTFFDKKIKASFTPNFEKRNYKDRLAGKVARSDEVTQYKLDLRYKIKKDLGLTYSFNFKDADSNKASGNFRNVLNVIKFTKTF